MSYIITKTNEKIVLPSRNYFQKGDSGTSIAIIGSFLTCNFMGYESKTGAKIDDVIGDYFGNNLEKWIKEFQRNNNLTPDGCIGTITLNKLREYGLNA